jgi:hypothetical protein
MRMKPTSLVQIFLKTRTSTIGYYLILVVSVISIYKIYKVGSGGDFQYYVTNGKFIADGINPYVNDFRSGTLGALAMYILSKITPSNSIQSLFFILNLLGILSILMYFKSKLTHSALLLCFIFAIWSAPYREIVVNGQITSMLYLLIFSSFLLLRKQDGTNAQIITVTTAALLSALAIDLKPHICLPIVIFIGLAQRRIRYLFSVITILFIGHTVIDLWLGRFTEIDWLRVLVGVQSSKQFSKWPDQYNIWPILDELIPGYNFWKIISAIFILGIFAVLLYLSLRKKEEFIWFVVASLSMVIPYSQLYSLTLLAVITIVRIMSTKINNIAYLFIIFVLIPRYWTEPKNILFVLMFLLLISVLNTTEKRDSFLENLKSAMMGTCLSILVHVLNDNSNLNEELVRSLICVEVTLFSIGFLVTQSKQLRRFRDRKIKI